MHVGSVTLCAPDETGWYCVQIDGLGEGGCGAWFETQPTFGFASRPVDRDASGSCNVLYSFDGSAWVGHDRRYTAKCPTLTQGSSVHWCADGSCVLLDAVAHEVEIRHFSGTTIKATAAGVEITGNGGVLDFVAQAAKVDKALADLAVHVHGSGTGPTTPPSPPYMAPTSVAATTLRCE